MIRLHVIDDGGEGQCFELGEEAFTIGRSASSEIRLQSEHLSPRHARVVVGIDETTVCDLGSTGTLLLRDGERTRVGKAATVLRDGDVLELGSGDPRCRLRVECVGDSQAAEILSMRSLDERSASALHDDPIAVRPLYLALCKIGRGRDLTEGLEAVAEAAFTLVPNATHVSVMLRELAADGDALGTGAYLPVLKRARRDRTHPRGADRVAIPRSIYSKVLRERTAVLCADAPEQFGEIASVMGASLQSAIAVPLWQDSQILGVLQVDNRSATGSLDERDLDLLLVLAEQVSLAIANWRLLDRLSNTEQQLHDENAFLRGCEERRRGGAGSGATIIGESEATRAMLDELDRVADTNVTVLIEGPTGTGKELIASALHHRSRRRDRLFVAQNCAALAETILDSELFGHKKGAFTGASEDKKGLFELADGSTLFLDEITEAPMAIQSKLLRVLQEGEIRPVGATEPKAVNVRIVAATNRDIEEEVRSGRFREDLYYRLKVYPLRVPALRDRRSDIPLLTRYFLDRFVAEIGKPIAGIADATIVTLSAYDWPGNVRELQNEVQRLVIRVDAGGVITPDLLSPQVRQDDALLQQAGGRRSTLKRTVSAVEKFVVMQALAECSGSKTEAARVLGMTREGLHKKLRHYDL